MPETKNPYDKLFTDEEVDMKARQFRFPGERSHGKVPRKPMVKDREVIYRTKAQERNRTHKPVEKLSSTPNYTRRRIGAGLVGLAAVGTAAVGINQNANGGGEDLPTPTTVVTAEYGDTIWGLQQSELDNSIIDPRTDVRPYVDKAVEMTGGSDIGPGNRVVLVDLPDKP